VTPVVSVTINVSDLDIECGEPGNALCCAVARAVRRAIPRARRVSVFGSKIEVNGRPYWADKRVERFVNEFDAALIGERPTVGAFSFSIDVEDALFAADECDADTTLETEVAA
jgi:hypothetical protein